MEKIKRAEEVMIPLDEYPHVPYWFTLRQVMAVMETSEFDINGKKSLPRFALVFDEAYQLLGLVRRRDIFRGLEPNFLSAKRTQYRRKLFDVEVDPNLWELSFDRLLKDIREQAQKPVKEVMLPITATVNHDDHIIKVIYGMVENNISLLPVLKDKKIVGVVRSVECFHEIAKMLME